MKIRNYLLLALFLLCSFTVFTQTNRNSYIRILPGKPIKTAVAYDGYKTFILQVPSNTLSVKVWITHAEADLDIYLQHGQELTNYDFADVIGITANYNEEILLSRLNHENLQPGTYYIDVIYGLSRPPVVNGVNIREIPFTINASFVTFDDAVQLLPGESVEAQLLPDEAMLKLFYIDVPADVSEMRIDIFNSFADCDFLIKKNQVPSEWDFADFIIEGYYGNESAIIDHNSYIPLTSGRYYILVLDQVVNSMVEDFSIIVDWTAAPPDFLLDIPLLSIPDDKLEYALKATVELLTDSAGGSGCLVSPYGLILTNWHVVSSYSGMPSENIIVNLNLDSTIPPKEVFRARVIDYLVEEDLALIEITEGFYGQPIPDDYVFPYFDFAENPILNIGEEVSIMGYPSVGGSGSRVTITYTKGTISGYDRNPFGIILKTDADINSGNSGGAALNDLYELIGIPSSVIGEDAGQLGYIHPISLIPENWFDIIEQSKNR